MYKKIMHINLASWTCTVEDHLLWFKEDFTGTNIFTRFVGYYVTLIFQFPIYLEPGTSYVGLPGNQRFQIYREPEDYYVIQKSTKCRLPGYHQNQPSMYVNI